MVRVVAYIAEQALLWAEKAQNYWSTNNRIRTHESNLSKLENFYPTGKI